MSKKKENDMIKPIGSIEPVASNVVVVPHDPPKLTAGGIHLPDTLRRRTIKGTVHAKGPDVKCALEIGDVVYLPDHGGCRLEIGKQVYLVYNEDELLCKEAHDERR